MRKSKMSSSSFYAREKVENRQDIQSCSRRRARMIRARRNVCRPYGRGFSCTAFPNQKRSIIMTRSMKRTMNEKQQELAIKPRNVFVLQSSFSAVNSAPLLDSSSTTVNPTSLVLEYSSTADSSQIIIELSATGIEDEMVLPVEDIGYLLDPEIPAPTPAEAAAKVEPAAADNVEATAGANGQPNPDGEPSSLKPIAIINSDLVEKLKADAVCPEEGSVLLNYEEEWMWNSKWFHNGRSRLWEMTDFGGMATSGVFDEDPFATFDLWNLWDGKQDPKPYKDDGNGFGNYDCARAS